VFKLEDFIKSLGRKIPSEQMENIIAIGNKRQIMKYCRRFPLATKPILKVTKAKVILPPKIDEEE
jgi:hypothetical protein